MQTEWTSKAVFEILFLVSTQADTHLSAIYSDILMDSNWLSSLFSVVR